MKTRDAFVGATLAIALVVGGCDTAKTELAKAKDDLAAATVQRDALKSQLEAAKTENTALAKQVTDLTTKMNEAKLSSTKLASHARAGQRASKRSARGASSKSKA